MSVPNKRRSSAKGRRNRAHSALKVGNPNLCPNCSAAVNPHQACLACGYYKGKKVLRTKTDVTLKRTEKRKKQEAKEKEKMASLKNK